MIALGAALVLVSGCRAPSGSFFSDLVVSAISVPAYTVAAEDTWGLGATVVNEGNATAASSSLAYWYSDDGIFDAGDVPIGISTIPPLAPGASFVDAWSDSYAVADSGGGAGTHWIFVVANADESYNSNGGVVAVLYDRIVIDTYRPKTGVIAANTFASLFDSSGDPTLEIGFEMWNGNLFPFTVDAPPVSIAEDDNGNPTFFGCARIDYIGGLAPGTYYVRIRGQQSTSAGVYAIRVLMAPDESYATWYFASTSDDSEYEDDDDPPSGGIPANPIPIAIGGRANRALSTGDVDWLMFTLP